MEILDFCVYKIFFSLGFEAALQLSRGYLQFETKMKGVWT